MALHFTLNLYAFPATVWGQLKVILPGEAAMAVPAPFRTVGLAKLPDASDNSKVKLPPAKPV